VADTFYVRQITEQSVIARMGVSSLLGPAGFRRAGSFPSAPLPLWELARRGSPNGEVSATPWL
jgi:hypothetical protein